MRWRVLWETDGENPDLPTVVDVPSDVDDVDEYLSEKYGYLVADRDLVTDCLMTEELSMDDVRTHWWEDQEITCLDQTETFWNNIHKSY